MVKLTYEELEEEIVYLKSLLEPEFFQWPAAIGLTFTESRFLWLLMHRKIVTKEALFHLLSHDREDEGSDDVNRLVAAHMTNLRRKLSGHYKLGNVIIVAVFRIGWRLDARYQFVIAHDMVPTAKGFTHDCVDTNPLKAVRPKRE